MHFDVFVQCNVLNFNVDFQSQLFLYSLFYSTMTIYTMFFILPNSKWKNNQDDSSWLDTTHKQYDKKVMWLQWSTTNCKKKKKRFCLTLSCWLKILHFSAILSKNGLADQKSQIY